MTSDDSHSHSQIRISFGFETRETRYKYRPAVTAV